MKLLAGSCAALLSLMVFPLVLSAGEDAGKAGGPPGGPPTGWSTGLQGGYVHQFDAGIDTGGSFSVDRGVVQASVGYSPSARRNVGLSLGYDYYGYNFSGSTGFGGLDPWNQVHLVRLGLPVRWGFGERWTAFVIPSVRATAEGGADFGKSISGGGFTGFSYRVSERLTIGPGFGAITQVEDDPNFFPVLIIDWKITKNLSLSTGRGLGATLGPGLALNWQATPKWSFVVGGRWERLRFRLDRNGNVPGGVGEDRAIPVYGGVGYSFGRLAQVSLVGGVDLQGELRLDNSQGQRITDSDHDPAGFLGLTFNLRF